MSTAGPLRAADPRRALIMGTLWSVGMRWSIKGLGLLSTVVLARILSPGDYGVVAMAMLAVGLAEVLIDFGANTALLREPHATPDFINSTWTLGIIQGLVVGGILALGAPLAGLHVKEPRVVWVIWAIAPCIVLGNFGNIGMTLARKELNFALEFRFSVAGKVIGVAITIAAAFALRDYRALVIGIAGGYLIGGLALSYVMHPYRPRWCTASFGAMWHFSKWLLISGIGQFAIRKADEIAAGRIGSTGQFGAYTVGADIGQLVTAEIGPPINRTLLPTFSALHEDSLRMKWAALKALAVVATVVLPLGVGMALVAPAATSVLLGHKWDSAVPFVAIFALIGAVRVISGPVATLLLVMGHSRLQASNVWIEFAVFGVAAFALVPHFGFIGLAYARLLSAVALTVVYVVSGRIYADMHLREWVAATWRPTVGVALMAALLPLLPDLGREPVLELTLQVVIGALIYIGWIALSWIFSGRPDGIERMALDRLMSLLRKKT